MSKQTGVNNNVHLDATRAQCASMNSLGDVEHYATSTAAEYYNNSSTVCLRTRHAFKFGAGRCSRRTIYCASDLQGIKI